MQSPILESNPKRSKYSEEDHKNVVEQNGDHGSCADSTRSWSDDNIWKVWLQITPEYLTKYYDKMSGKILMIVQLSRYNILYIVYTYIVYYTVLRMYELRPKIKKKVSYNNIFYGINCNVINNTDRW